VSAIGKAAMSDPDRCRRLLASIHDVSPRFDGPISSLYDRMTRLLGGAKLAMLVVPDFWGEAPISRSPAFRRKLRAWAEEGVEMFVHGWSHRDRAVGHRGLAALKARYLTAGEGEFLGLTQDEAALLMGDGKALLEDIIGGPVAGFVAPAWLYSDGAFRALKVQGFALAEDHFKVWRPSDSAVLARGPVVSWASRSGPRVRASLAFAAVARKALRPSRTIRLAVHPGDNGVPALLGSIDATVAALVASHAPGRYRDLQA
jgi:predicted deacetylase